MQTDTFPTVPPSIQKARAKEAELRRRMQTCKICGDSDDLYPLKRGVCETCRAGGDSRSRHSAVKAVLGVA